MQPTNRKPKLRRYQPIWEMVKEKRRLYALGHSDTPKLAVLCSSAAIPRVVKAVIKEKDIDLEYKVVNKFKLKVLRQPELGRIIFSLE